MQLGVTDVEDGVRSARALLDEKWLARQLRLEPSDSLLLHLKPLRSANFQIHGIRHGVPEGMYPLAEAVKVGEEVLEQYRRDGRLLGSTALYLLRSLVTLQQYRDRIEDFDKRVRRLYRDEAWKATLYELLTAAAYASLAGQVRLLNEAASATPDMEVTLGVDRVFIECKARLHYEDLAIAFVQRWRREALGDIASYLRQVDFGAIVRIAIHDDAAIRKLPTVIREMVTRGEHVRDTATFHVEIDPIHPAVAEIGPDPTSVSSAEFWRRTLGFDEWRRWHYVLPGGNFKLANLSNAMATAVQRPVLICVRSTALADNEVRVLPSLRDACRRQLRHHSPGILHVLVNSDLFGLGQKASMEYVTAALEVAGQKLFHDYRRVFRVVFDIVKPPEWGAYRVEVRRVCSTNSNCPAPVSGYPEPPPVLLY